MFCYAVSGNLPFFCFSLAHTKAEKLTTKGQKHKAKNSSIHLDENGIIHLKIEDGTCVELDENKLIIENCYKLAKKGEAFLFVESGKYSSISKEAREFATTPYVYDLFYAQAIVIENVAQRIIVNFLKAFYNKKGGLEKMRVFTDRKLAYQWLLHKKTQLKESK